MAQKAEYFHMIVNAWAKGWEVFYQRGHAMLAAQIGSHLAWKIGDRPARLVETIAAIFHHDDLAKEWESDHLSEVGTPLDFTLQIAQQNVEIEPLEAVIDHARYRGRWVALLVSMHCCFLNAPKRGESAAVAEFLRQQKAQQRRWQRNLGITTAQANQAYAFLQWCDRLSLILCRRELPSRQRAIEISQGPDGKRYDAIQNANGSVTIRPWPFQSNTFSVDVEAVYLTQPTFKSNDALIEALRTARINTIEWEFVKEDTPKQTSRSLHKRVADKHRAQPLGEE